MMSDAVFRRFATFGSLPFADRSLLSDLMVRTESINARRDFVSLGHAPVSTHLIVDGWACRYIILKGGERQITSILLPGDILDLDSEFATSAEYSASAITDLKFVRLDSLHVRKMLDRPTLARALRISQRIAELSLQMRYSMGRRSGMENLSHFLCELYTRLSMIGMTEEQDLYFPLTQADIGDALGLTSVHCNRVIRKLVMSGLATVKRPIFQIHDMQTLSKIANFDKLYLIYGSFETVVSAIDDRQRGSEQIGDESVLA